MRAHTNKINALLAAQIKQVCAVFTNTRQKKKGGEKSICRLFYSLCA